ncbi:MAG: hypothetical protein WC495_02360 [Patescibacteria group bacterium]
MSIPVIIFAAIYFILFLVWVFYSLITIYNVLRYAYWTRLPLVLVFVYLFLSTCFIFGTGWSLRDVDWKDSTNLETPTITIPSTDSLRNSLP